jgi:uncharacterized protein YjbJ (UPF0337 family)
MKGKIKETVGRVARSKRLKTEGRMQYQAGRIQRKLGEAERDLEKDLDRDRE